MGRRRTGEHSKSGLSWESHGGDGGDAIDPAIDPDELTEFLAGEPLECEADPIFKERLREKLWRIVRRPKSST
jgi:hypothetical protein